MFQSTNHIFHIRDFPLLVVFHDLIEEEGKKVQVVALQEPLHPDALCYQIEQVLDPSWIGLTMLRYHAADRNAPTDPHVEKRSIQHVTPHIIKVDVDPLRKVPVRPPYIV